MPGPNSAPNGRASLVRGYPAEDYHVDEKTGKATPLRIWESQRKQLWTGKTDAKRMEGTS